MTVEDLGTRLGGGGEGELDAEGGGEESETRIFFY